MDELDRKTADEAKKGVRFPVVVVLDNVRSMQNIGSVFRTADAFNIEAMYLCGITAQPPHRDIQKTALGATESVPWYYHAHTMSAIQSLISQGYAIYAVEQTTKAVSLPKYTFELKKDKVAFVFGNEVDGVDSSILAMCHAAIEIPQWGMKHSLNISVAAGIVLWEVVRNWSLSVLDDGNNFR